MLPTLTHSKSPTAQQHTLPRPSHHPRASRFSQRRFEGALLHRRRAHIEEESLQALPFPPPLGQAVIHFSGGRLDLGGDSFEPVAMEERDF
ncbi:uncharacterized protein DS421_9g273280 [Arachis hypogaea]|nr:uncharacterized protein DS421_9g273280 [Arachis hypogaea]